MIKEDPDTSANCPHMAATGYPDRQALPLAIDDDVQSGVVDALVGDPREHLHTALLEQGSANPAGGLGQAVADLRRLALQQPDLAPAGFGSGRLEAARVANVGVIQT